VILDANVLLDYLESDPSILLLAGSAIEPIVVPSPVLEELGQLSRDAAQQFGVRSVEPSVADRVTAANEHVEARVSAADYHCFMLARSTGELCVTNDAKLRGLLKSSVKKSGARKLWRGLELIVELVRIGRLSHARAIEVADIIYDINPFNADGSLSEFTEIIRNI